MNRITQILSAGLTGLAVAALMTAPRAATAATDKKPAASESSHEKLEPLKLVLPKPAFLGTPKNIVWGPNIEKPTGKPRPPFLAPAGVINVALHKPVTASDNDPITGTLDQITDGDKRATEGCWVELGPGVQWAQIDLKGLYKIYAVVVWHYHAEARIYKDVVVQTSEDRDFITGVHTLFNNDMTNEAGQGVGHDKQYVESYEGKLIPGHGVVGRYVRLYSDGNTADGMNDYTEVEVYGLPVH